MMTETMNVSDETTCINNGRDYKSARETNSSSNPFK